MTLSQLNGEMTAYHHYLCDSCLYYKLN